MFSTVKRLVYLDHALDVLEALERFEGEASISRIASEIRVSKSGVYRILNTLRARGYIDQNPNSHYRLGLRIRELARATPEQHIVTAAAPYMEEVVQATGESSFLGVLDGFSMIPIHGVEARQTVRVHIDIGSRTPAHCTSTGLALIANLPREHLDAVLPTVLPRMTSYTITDRRQLLGECRRIRERGYVINVAGWREDAGGVAAPIFGRDGQLAAAVCVAAPRTRLPVGRLDELGAVIVKLASQISRALGCPGDRVKGGDAPARQVPLASTRRR